MRWLLNRGWGTQLGYRQQSSRPQNARGFEITVRAAQKTEKLIKPAFLRMELSICPQMPLADQPRHISGRFQAARNGLLAQWQTQARTIGIELMPKPGLTAPG
jgi:hypothetical protein